MGNPYAGFCDQCIQKSANRGAARCVLIERAIRANAVTEGDMEIEKQRRLRSGEGLDWLAGVRAGLETKVLKDVSRSFYLSLRLLPKEMRGAVSVAYLLARASDTLADTALVPVSTRIALLDQFASDVAGIPAMAWKAVLEKEFLPSQEHEGERVLLTRLKECLSAKNALPGEQRCEVESVLATIISGQKLDLERFGCSSADSPVHLQNEEELWDYAYRVAGCVGEFWTKIGFLTLHGLYATQEPSLMLEKGIRFGQGLQLVNILRDAPRDWNEGRCYLPVKEGAALEDVFHMVKTWIPRAEECLWEGVRYAQALPVRRLRAATLLPASLGLQTLKLLRNADFIQWRQRVKIPRSMVYREMLGALMGRSPAA